MFNWQCLYFQALATDVELNSQFFNCKCSEIQPLSAI
jgi:hypothetical protein